MEEAAPSWAGPPGPEWDDPDRDQQVVWVPASPARQLVGGLVTACWMLPLTALMLVAIGMLVAKVIFGLTPLSVRSGSMEPAIPTYALAFVDEVPVDRIRERDVITFDPPGPHGRVTHRVVKTYEMNEQRFFETKGDANPAVDDWRRVPTAGAVAAAADAAGASVRQTRGIAYDGNDAVRYVFHVPLLGHVGIWLERPEVRGKVIYLPFVLIGLWLLAMIWARPFDRVREEVGEWVPLHELPTFGASSPAPLCVPAATISRLRAVRDQDPASDVGDVDADQRAA